MRKFIPYIFLGIIFLVVWLASYLGAFRPVNLQKESRPEFTILFKDYMGPYHKIVPTIEYVEKWSKAHGIFCQESFGEYFDNPDVVEEARLKARAGCVVKNEEKDLIKDLPEDIHSETIPARYYVSVLFEGAPSIGPVKVYPKAYEYIKQNLLEPNGAVIEIYNIESKDKMTTTYLFPVK